MARLGPYVSEPKSRRSVLLANDFKSQIPFKTTDKWPRFFFKKVLFFCCLLPKSQSFRPSSDKTLGARHGQERMRPKGLRSEFFRGEDLASGDLVSLDL